MKKGCFVSVLLVLSLCLGAVLFGPTLVDKVMHMLYPKPYEEFVSREAAEFELDENLIYAVMKAESGFDENARSHADAHGLMQLTESTFHWIASMYPPENGGTDLFDPSDNIHCASALLRLLLNEYDQNLDVAICAYNAGMGNVAGWLSGGKYSHDGINLHTIPYPETRAYLSRVKEYYATYKKLYED